MDGTLGHGYLFESTLRFLNHNYGWARVENVDQTSELLLGENPLPSRFLEQYIIRVQAYSFGYDREVGHWPVNATALGAQLSWYGVPRLLNGLYGSHPAGVLVFLRIRTG